MGRRDLPDNLHSWKNPATGVTYYKYYDARTGKHCGLGTDKATAIEDAKALNLLIAHQIASERVKIITGKVVVKKSSLTLKEFSVTYMGILKALVDKDKLAENTYRTRKCAINGATNINGHIPLRDFTTKDVVKILNHYTDQGKNRMAQTIRSALSDLFIEAIQLGECENNPAKVAKNPAAEVKRQRLLIDEYMEIHSAAVNLVDMGKMQPWVPRAFNLMLVSAQRPVDGVRFKYTDVKDDHLHVIPSKTKRKSKIKIQIPTALRLDAIDMTLADCIKDCRDGILSRYMIHHTKNYGNALRGSKVHEQSLSKKFTQARKHSGLTWDGDEADYPTLYELRSLAKRLYNEQGIDTKTLLAHTTDRMSDLYQDDRGREWKRLKL